MATPARPPWLAWVLLPMSLLLWAVGVSEVNVAKLGVYGLPAILPPVFYAGVILLIVSAGFEFAQAKISELKLALHAVVLAVILYGTAPLIYTAGRYAWLYKTTGVIQYVGANGKLDRSIDVYQIWSGFFALAAWFDKVAGVSSPLDYGKWAQLAFELAAIPLLYSIYRSLFLPTWHRWLAIMLYLAANWIAQDYLSPQGVSTLLSLGIMSIACRWLFRVDPVRRKDDGQDKYQGNQRSEPRSAAWSLQQTGPFIVALLGLFFVLTFTHELSPYIITIQVAILAALRLARPRWVAAALVLIVIGYLLPNFAYVNSHFGIVSSIGNFFSNIQPPSSSGGGVLPKSHTFISACCALLSLGMWGLALVGAWLRRKSRRVVIALLVLTFSPILVLAAGGYGQEGILRVYLFSLPWAAALVTCALAPLRAAKDAGARNGASVDSMRAGRGALRAALPLAIAIALFFPAFFGDDYENLMPQGQVNALLEFQNSVKPGPVIMPFINLPISDTAHYNLFPTGQIFGEGGAMGTRPVDSTIATFLASTMKQFTNGKGPAYLVMNSSQVAYNEANGFIPANDFTILDSSLKKSPYWSVIMDQSGTVIYQLSGKASAIPSQPYAKDFVIGVP